MENRDFEEIDIVQQILDVIHGEHTDEELRVALNSYHENDIAAAFEELEEEERKVIYKIIGVERVSEIFPYLEDVSEYLDELSIEQQADVLENMDVDDAIDVLEDIEDEEIREEIISHMEQSASEDIRLVYSYEDDEIGSMMTTNFITVASDSTVKGAMKSVVSQAKENDNITTIYIEDEEGKYYGAMDLRDLIIAREYTPLDTIISRNYPSVDAHEKISDVIEELKDYAENSIPVLDEENKVIGIITSQDIVEAVDDELGEDYAKFAGLTAEEDLKEKLFDSMKKRIPWLILLLVLGLLVSTVVGVFEAIVAQVAIIICFQSLILDMAGNVGTQSLAVTIRVLMDENISGKEKFKFVLKEMRVGLSNGVLLGSIAFVFVGCYLHLLKGYSWGQGFEISGCVGISLLLAMVISSLVGTVIPMFFHKIKVDPAVASGPLITTVNDLVAVVTYYGLAGLLLVGRM